MSIFSEPVFRIAVLAVIVAATMAACDVNGADSSTLSRKEYVRQVNAIYCDQSGPPDPGGFDLGKTAEYLDETIPLAESAVRQIRELRPPPALARKADSFVRALETLLSASREIRDAARRGDRDEFVAASGKAFGSGLQVSKRAHNLGLSECP